MFVSVYMDNCSQYAVDSLAKRYQLQPQGISMISKQLPTQPTFIITSLQLELEFGPMPNVMAALPNIGGALCSALQSLADAH